VRAVRAVYARDRPVRRPGQFLGRKWVTLEIEVRGLIVRMLCMRWIGYFVCGWHRDSLAVPSWVQGLNIDLVRQMKKLVPPEATGAPTASAASATVVLEEFPSLMEHLTCRAYEDGSPRQTSMLMTSVIGSMWRVTLKDRDAAMQLNILGATFDDALVALELALGNDKTPWEPDSWAAGKAASKKKK